MSYPFHSAPAEQALSPVSVCGVEISRDADGRFSLNDLHRAAGGEKRHQPSNWLQLDQTKALIAELRKSLNCSVPGIPGTERIKNLEPVVTLQGFGAQGTYVARELVYGYAMWISPAFHLTVIRTFDALVTGRPWSAPGQVQGELFGPVLDPAKLASTFGQFLRLGKLGGLDEALARRVADRETSRLLGISPLAVLGVPTPANGPSYTVVEPEPGPEVLPMTELLHRHGDPLSAREMNLALEHAGLLERRTLEVAGCPARIYPVLVGEGLHYGANVKGKARYLTSHPMYYPAAFPALLARVAEARAELAAATAKGLAGKDASQMSKRQRAAYQASGLAEARKEQKRLDQRVARQEAALEALARGERWPRVSAKLNLAYYFATAELTQLRHGQRPIEILDGEVPAEVPASLKVTAEGVDGAAIPFSEWLKTRH